MRVILHADFNYFYAQVECLLNPALRDVPMCVAGDAEKRHGIVLAKNPLASEYGVKTGQTLWEAKKLCAKLVTVSADFSSYLYYSEQGRRIMQDFTDRIEPFGADECWLDVTESTGLFGDGKTIADELRRRMREELGLTVSVGVAWNKVFAKFASEQKKPDATTVITQENYRRTVWTADVGELLYVGAATGRKLRELNIMTIGQLAQADESLLVRKLGKWGAYLRTFARGEETMPVAKFGELPEAKSVGNSLTAPRDLFEDEEVKTLLFLLAESVASRCREQGFARAGVVSVWIRYGDLTSFHRQCRLNPPTMLVGELTETAFRLFLENRNPNMAVRAAGLSVSEFQTDEGVQLSLLRDEPKHERAEQLQRAVQDIRAKYGESSIQRARLLADEDLRDIDIKQEHTVHPEAFRGMPKEK